MNQLPKYIFIFGSLSLFLVFTAPVWRITLEAPQYPDGVTMYIWINKLGGKEPGTIQNINILNHYVGMKMIEPDAIPELKYFPIVVISMAILGVICGFINRRGLWLSWVIVLMLLGALGLYDFYLWEYDYGHNLSPEAPIKIPGQAYQPPFFGSKMLLNFNAISYPHFGAIYIVTALTFGLAAFFIKKSRN